MNYTNYLKLINNSLNYTFTLDIKENLLEVLTYHRLLGCSSSVRNNIKSTLEKYIEELKPIFLELDTKKIRYIALKAFSLFDYYKNLDVREFNDIDLLVDPKKIDDVIKIIQKYNYKFGYINYNTMSFKEATRKEILFSRLNTHEIVKLIKRNDDLFIKIDINFLFQWRMFNNSQIDFDILYQNSIIGSVISIRQLNKIYNILHLSCHFYNETTGFVFSSDNLIKDPQELKLFRLIDIIFILKEIDISDEKKLIFLSEKHKINHQIIYTLRMIDAFFPHKLSSELKEYMNNNQNIKNNINIYYKKNGDIEYWPISVYERAFNFQKKDEIIKKMEF